MIEELAQSVGEHLHDDDDYSRHNHPFRNLREKVFLDYLAEAKTKDEHYHGRTDSRPKHETLAKCSDVHNSIGLIGLTWYRPVGIEFVNYTRTITPIIRRLVSV